MKPAPCLPGDTIRIVSTGSPVKASDIEGGIKFLENEGYHVELGVNVFATNNYLAGTDEQRADDFMCAFTDPNVKLVLSSRGGYGTSRLLPLLDLDRIVESRKLFLGYSDVTAIHTALTNRGLPSIYGPMPITFGSKKEPWVYESFLNSIQGRIAIPDDIPAAISVVDGVSEGIVSGGTLCLLTDSIGTSEAFDPQGKIILIEDVDEHSYRVDAMLTHMVQAGMFEGAVGIVVGEMTRTDSKEEPSIGTAPWRDIVKEILAPLNLPLIIDYPFGHCKAMLSVPLGIRARLDATSGRLSYLESLCE
jgi:muramoyltetrapeptide carboxypeptidase